MGAKIQVVDKSGTRFRNVLFGSIGYVLHAPYRALYNSRRRNLLASRSSFPHLKVISVGALSMGGAGKTPCVSAILKRLLSRGRRGGVVLKLGRNRLAFLDEFIIHLNTLMEGADPSSLSVESKRNFLFARTPTAFVAAGTNKLTALQLVSSTGQYEFAIVDDGFQLFSLESNLNVCLFAEEDAREPTFPRGNLREGLDALQRADVILLREVGTDPETDILNLREKSFQTRIFPMGFFPITELYRPWLSPLNSSPVDASQFPSAEAIIPTGSALLFSGIANPKSFEESALSLHPDTSLSIRFSDHRTFRHRDVQLILNTSKRRGCKFQVTTEKDASRMLPYLMQAMSAEGRDVLFPEILMPRVTPATPYLALALSQLAETCFYLKVQSQLPPEFLARIDHL